MDVTDNDPYNGDLGLQFVPEIDLLAALQQNMEAKGAEIFFGHTSERIAVENGRAVGVITRNADGTYKKFLGTRGVAIAADAFDADPQMFDYYCPTVSHNAMADAAPRFNAGTGDGIKQGIWAGGCFQRLADCASMIFWGATNCIKNVMVNKSGRRFIDENATQSNFTAAFGLLADALAATVEEYNGFCATGIDEAFHKDPATLNELTGPYYATAYSAPRAWRSWAACTSTRARAS